jgi:hypothetical protein
MSDFDTTAFWYMAKRWLKYQRAESQVVAAREK